MHRPGVFLAMAAGVLAALVAVPALADDASPSPSPVSASPAPPPSPSTSASPSPSQGRATGSPTPSPSDLAMRAEITPDVGYEGDIVTVSVRVTRAAGTPDGAITVQLRVGQLRYLDADDEACRDDGQGYLHCPLPPAGTTETLHVRFRVGYVPSWWTDYTVGVRAFNPNQSRYAGLAITLRNPRMKPSPTPSHDYFQLNAHYDPSTATPGHQAVLVISADNVIGANLFVSRGPLTLIKCLGDSEGCWYQPRRSEYLCKVPETWSGRCLVYFRVTGCPRSGKITQQIELRDPYERVFSSTSVTLVCRAGAGSSGATHEAGDLPVTGASLPLYAATGAILLAGGTGLVVLTRRRRARTEHA